MDDGGDAYDDFFESDHEVEEETPKNIPEPQEETPAALASAPDNAENKSAPTSAPRKDSDGHITPNKNASGTNPTPADSSA